MTNVACVVDRSSGSARSALCVAPLLCVDRDPRRDTRRAGRAALPARASVGDPTLGRAQRGRLDAAGAHPARASAERTSPLASSTCRCCMHRRQRHRQRLSQLADRGRPASQPFDHRRLRLGLGDSAWSSRVHLRSEGSIVSVFTRTISTTPAEGRAKPHAVSDAGAIAQGGEPSQRSLLSRARCRARHLRCRVALSGGGAVWDRRARWRRCPRRRGSSCAAPSASLRRSRAWRPDERARCPRRGAAPRRWRSAPPSRPSPARPRAGLDQREIVLEIVALETRSCGRGSRRPGTRALPRMAADQPAREHAIGGDADAQFAAGRQDLSLDHRARSGNIRSAGRRSDGRRPRGGWSAAPISESPICLM